MVSFKKRMHHSRYRTVLTCMFSMPIIAVLGFFNIIPVSNTLAWFALAAFIVSLIVYFGTFKKRNPADEIN
ncbi:hypothetical protein [Alkalihalobacillus trypoxylicola]|uniref:Uncharacterized protein n=1 Tax=Alkalihalobacillus trypoxylicola TaxID=519424 RepID=A0A161PKX4_9BACI|nr:hypothetical protein [Alkalihalobacillus trypoxylicola]KYG34956.1 hypothetical protein AZF04_01080 [Alkalihalobacillus trypoxylicola]